MKIVVFVEGETEAKIIGPLVRRWLDKRCNPRVGVSVVRFQGWADYFKHIARKVALQLGPAGNDDTAGALGLLDLYGPTFYPPNVQTVAARNAWAKAEIEGMVGNPRFRQHMAVHEVEAWLLAQPGNFPRAVAESLPKSVEQPEKVNFNNPPARLLDGLYYSQLRRPYRKIVDGNQLFEELDLDVARTKCPSLAAFLDDAVLLAGC